MSSDGINRLIFPSTSASSRKSAKRRAPQSPQMKGSGKSPRKRSRATEKGSRPRKRGGIDDTDGAPDVEDAAARARAAAAEAAAARKAAVERARQEEIQCFETLPTGLRQRRSAGQHLSFVEYVDELDRSNAVSQLRAFVRTERAADGTPLTPPQLEEAKYLVHYLQEYTILLTNYCGGPRSGVLPSTCASAQGRAVLNYKFEYFSRRGAGRRYTTIGRDVLYRPPVQDTNRPPRSICRTESVYALPRKAHAMVSKAVKDPFDRRSYGMQGCPRALRAALVGRMCRDIDIKNAHPQLASQLMERCLAGKSPCNPAELTFFSDYVRNRDTPNGWIERIGEAHDLGSDPEVRKECVKQLMCRLMFGGSYKAWMREPLGSSTVARCPKGPPMTALIEVERELATLRQVVFESDEWGAFERRERRRLRGRGHDETKISRTIFSTIMQTLENDILEIMVEVLHGAGWKTTTLIFDGCHVLDNVEGDLDTALRRVEAEVHQRTGFRIELVEKPLFGLHTDPINLTRL